MRFLTIVVTVLALLYSGYWFVGATLAERGARGVLDGLSQEGLDVSYSDLSTRGFPSRFDTTVSELSITDPGTGLGWIAPFVQVFALSYQPNRVIAVWPDTQQITIPGQTLGITSTGLRASAAVAPNTDLPLDSVTAESGPMQITSDLGWTMGLERLVTAFRAAGPDAANYDFYLDGTGLALPEAIRLAVDPESTLPPLIDMLRIDSALRYDRPIDRFAQEGVLLQDFGLRGFRLVWGEMIVTGTGDLTFDAEGVPEGTLNLVAEEWRQMIDLAVNAALITEDVGRNLRNAATLLAGSGGSLEASIGFQDGRMLLGPIPLGPAPRLPRAPGTF